MCSQPLPYNLSDSSPRPHESKPTSPSTIPHCPSMPASHLAWQRSLREHPKEKRIQTLELRFSVGPAGHIRGRQWIITWVFCSWSNLANTYWEYTMCYARLRPGRTSKSARVLQLRRCSLSGIIPASAWLWQWVSPYCYVLPPCLSFTGSALVSVTVTSTGNSVVSRRACPLHRQPYNLLWETHISHANKRL